MYITDVEHERILILLEQAGSALREAKAKIRQACSEGEYVKSSTIIELCDTIEYRQREFARLDDMLTELENAF